MNKQFLKLWSIILCVILTGWLSSCKEDEPPLPNILVSFEVDEVGLSDEDSELEININLSRAVSAATTVEISYTADGVVYGEDFTTNPAATGNTLSVTIPANSTAASFSVIREDDTFLEGTESITFALTDAASTTEVLIGETSDIVIFFSSIVSAGSQLTLQGIEDAEAGSGAARSVFVDFSSNTQTHVLRTNWDLGFYSGSEFRVKLNNTSGASAVMVNKTDMNDVTSVDIDGVSLAVGQGQGTLSLIDGTTGNIGETLIAEISATETDNMVYVINRAGGSGSTGAVEDFVKVRILRSASGYTVQYAKINETTFSTTQITKDDASNFQYFNFTTGAVNVEPGKVNWDIQWTWSIYFTGGIPYGFSDLVFINHLGGVKGAEVLTSSVSYADYNEASIATTTLLDGRNVIGSNWRVTSGGTVGVKTDRFYVIQDAAGNVYKLKFINFHASDGGTRGKPLIEYALVKKAE